MEFLSSWLLEGKNSVEKMVESKAAEWVYLAKWKESTLQRQRSRLTRRVGTLLLGFTLCLFLAVYLAPSPTFIILTLSFAPFPSASAQVCVHSSHERGRKTHGVAKTIM